MNIEKENNKIKTIRIYVSNKLNKEIEYALRNLKDSENNKSQGKKKHKWTKIEASEKLGIWLRNERKNRNI